jgi:hypothetical protein
MTKKHKGATKARPGAEGGALPGAGHVWAEGVLGERRPVVGRGIGQLAPVARAPRRRAGYGDSRPKPLSAA